MTFKSRYEAKKPDESGYVDYTDEENETWKILYLRQSKILPGRACKEHIEGLSLLGLSENEIPQLPDVNHKLSNQTGWQVEPVAALISHEKFFQLLASQKFPAATFIRTREELNYIKEPDIFHEFYGHCPMLTQPDFAQFVQKYAEKTLSFPEEDWPLLQRLFWFTVEFGLIQTDEGLRAYGGGILSSTGETPYSVESNAPQRQLFNPVTVFRTPYRIDMMQPIYFVVESYKQLYDFINDDVSQYIEEARELGEFPPLFEVDKDNPNIHIRVC